MQYRDANDNNYRLDKYQEDFNPGVMAEEEGMFGVTTISMRWVFRLDVEGTITGVTGGGKEKPRTGRTVYGVLVLVPRRRLDRRKAGRTQCARRVSAANQLPRKWK